MIDILTKEVITRDIENFRDAAAIATTSTYSTRVGCVAAINRKFVCGAFNTQRNLPKNVPHLEATRHAEHNCLAMVPAGDLEKVTLYIARLNRANQRLPSRPCVACMAEIVSLGVREVVYINKHARLVKEYW